MKKALSLGLGSLLVAGCSSTQDKVTEDVREILRQGIPDYISMENVRVSSLPYVADISGSSVLEMDQGRAWLQSIRVSISEPDRPVSLKEIARMFASQGITITNSMPLGDYWYSGLGALNTDAFTALNTVLGSLSLDFRIDGAKKLVEIVPMESRKWTLNAPNSASEFKMAGESEGRSGDGEGDSSSSSSGGDGLTGVSSSSSESSSSSLSSTGNFWDSLEKELGQLTTIIVRQDTKGPDASEDDGRQVSRVVTSRSGGQEMFKEVRVGRVSINRDTGSVTVQAPNYMLSDIDAYMDRIENQMNTVVSIKGMIVFVSSDESESKGVDLSAFARFAGEYGLAVTNNALGGLTLTQAGSGGVAAIDAPTGNGSNFGIIKDNNMLRTFNAFLESNGSVKTLQRPNLSSTHGMPVVFSSYDTTYVNQVSEEAASGGGEGGAQVARQNKLIPFQFGTALRVLPRVDLKNKQVRAQIALTQVLEAGTQVIEQVVGDANGGTKTLQTSVPLDRRIDVAGEIIVPDNSLVIFGGQRVSSENGRSSGVTGLKKSWFWPLFGNKTAERSETIYYVALQVNMHERGK